MRILALVIIFNVALLGRLGAQTYPYWDTNEPGFFSSIDPILGPLVATTNAVFGVWSGGGAGGATVIARWTLCDGWQPLDGLASAEMEAGTVKDMGSMTIHDHYLYAVGSFYLTGDTNSYRIVKFDLNTGVWYPLGQDFAATNILKLTTVAVDTNNWIYVGFAIYSPNTNGDPPGFAGQTVDLLDMSTNDGASWQAVGGGLTLALPMPGSDMPYAAVSALHADGTNIYIGGDFSGPSTGAPSPHITMWTGNAWFPLQGVDAGPPPSNQYGYVWGLDTVNAITSSGTNIYVAGGFYSPQAGLARFSNVTGDSLPIIPIDTNAVGDYQFFCGSAVLNNGNLYVGGYFVMSNNIATNVVCLTNAEDGSPAGWGNIGGGSYIEATSSLGVTEMATTRNGNAIFALGQSSEESFGVSRWMLGPDAAPPSVIVTNESWESNVFTCTFIGTPGSHWQVMTSSDATNWFDTGEVTLWGGTINYTDVYSMSQPYYQLVNDCTNSAIFSAATLVNVQFANPGDPQQVGFAGIGIFTNDFWNMVQGASYDGDDPIYYGGALVTDADLVDNQGRASGYSLVISATAPGSYDPPISYYNAGYGADTIYPLINSMLFTGEDSDFYLDVGLPEGHTYDVYVYSVTPYAGGSRISSTFTLSSYSGVYHSTVNLSDWSSETPSQSDYSTDVMEEGNQYVVFRGLVAGSWTIHVTGGYVMNIVNGLQVSVH